ncbi:ABC transporter ATP-binding protein, partial [uncultured Leifsonia sp.]|uniref:ABC transporter ATP-binding protein n=1 Tax=uncultured Leifsonia sp. TaxID=340359 RepID=UPI0037DC633C
MATASRPEQPAPVAVRADDWGWRYAGRRAWAARGLSLAIEPGERVLLLGASGAGKSTLLAGLAGVLGGDDDGESEGALLLDGRSPTSSRGRAGLLLQDPDAQVILARVGDDVAFACENLGVPREEIWRRVGGALAAVGLELPLGHSTAQLSGGQKQRLALAGLLAMRPGLLLLDEPTANLDPEGVLEVRDAVAAAVAATGATLVVVEHRVAVWRDLVDRVIVLDADGGVLADGAPDRVLADAAGRLREAGVWLPDTPVPAAPSVTEGERLLAARDLAIGRGPGISRR